MKKSIFRHRTQTCPNCFYSINSFVDKVYNAKKKFGTANHYRKIGRKKGSEKSDILKNIFGKTQKHMVLF